MKFDPTTKSLMSDEGALIKVLSCPLRMRVEGLLSIGESGHWHCRSCSSQVFETANLLQEDVQRIVLADPGACLVVRRGQPNIEIV